MRYTWLGLGWLLAQSGRYWDSLFTYRVETVQYGTAQNLYGSSQDLQASFYLPENDPETRRPVIVLLFGGGYISGSRNDSDVTYLARYFAKRGYVTATIDYRIGVAFPTATEWINAGIRAVHDLKAFVRFLKRSVAEQNNPYGIDTSRIYVGGSSAGAFTALHAAYVTSPAELAQVPQADTAYVRSQGGIEGRSGNPGYSSQFAAVFSLSGGMLKTDWISSAKVSAVVAMHGTGDNTVSYKKGTLPFIALEVEGGYNIDSVAAERGLYHALFTWQGAGHVPYGGQQSLNPPYMSDVETFLRYHFYQWNSRFSTSLTPAFQTETFAGPFEVIGWDGRRVGTVDRVNELPSGLWLLRSPQGHCRRVLRP